jgi:TolB-like protein
MFAKVQKLSFDAIFLDKGAFLNNFFSELKRRNVVRVGIAYVVVSWVILQFIDIIQEIVRFPGWFPQMVLVLLIIGLPIALIFSWAYEVTPEGVKKTEEVDKSKSIIHGTGQKINKLIIGALVLAVGFIVYDKMIASDEPIVSQVEAGRASIAVLPFKNLSGLPENEQFTNGLHDDLLTQLSKINSLKVISRTSVMEYRDTTKNIKQIADELGVTTLMEGGIQRVGNRIRINVQLIDANTDEHLWAETYDREMTVANIFDIQSEIAMNITTALKAMFDPEAVRELPTESLEAYEAFLKGRLALETTNYSLDSLLAVRAYFEAAVTIDPDFALAWANISIANDNIYWFTDQSDENRAATLAAAEKALELDPGLSEGHYAMGKYYYHGLLDYDRALAELALAEEGMAGNADFLGTRAAVFRRSGNIEAAAVDFVKAADLNPKDFLLQIDAIATLDGLRRFTEADARTDNLPETTKYKTQFSLVGPYDVFTRTGNPGPALEVFDTLEDQDFGNFYVSPYTYFELLMVDGRYQDALDMVEWDIWGPWRGFETFAPLDMLRGIATFLIDPVAARPLLESALTGFEGRLVVSPEQPYLFSLKSYNLALLGRHDEAVAAARYAMEIVPLERDAWFAPVFVEKFAQILAMAGRYDEAIEVLDQYLPLPGAVSLRTVMAGIPQTGLENHPGFAELVEKHGWIQKEATRNE